MKMIVYWGLCWAAENWKLPYDDTLALDMSVLQAPRDNKLKLFLTQDEVRNPTQYKGLELG